MTFTGLSESGAGSGFTAVKGALGVRVFGVTGEYGKRGNDTRGLL